MKAVTYAKDHGFDVEEGEASATFVDPSKSWRLTLVAALPSDQSKALDTS